MKICNSNGNEIFCVFPLAECTCNSEGIQFDNNRNTFCYLTEDRSATDCYTFTGEAKTGVTSLTCDMLECPCT